MTAPPRTSNKWVLMMALHPVSSADKAWMVLVAGVITWDVVCEPGQMLSEASAQHAKDHPFIAYLVVGSVAAHLVGRIPSSVDPIHWLGVGLRNVRKRVVHV